MILRQLLHTDPVVGASYVVACAGKQTAMVIDPMAAPDEYIRIAEATTTTTGSVCGRGLSGAPFSTIGFERRFNKAFNVTDRDAFIANMLRDIPPRPLNAADNRRANLGIAADDMSATAARL